ncbi:MAG: energy transducer TonB [Saprospiraceae bacterium]|nr:energy transducer TonB [Saprospiraceae bacterium]
MDTTLSHKEKRNKRRSMLTSIAAHLLLIILALLPLLTFPDPPPGQEGILVNLGVPDEGSGFENAGPSQPQEQIEEEEEEPVAPPQPEEETSPEPAPPEPEPDIEPEPEPAPEKEVVTTEDPEAVALRKKREEEARKKAQEEARKKAEEEARKKAEEEARRKAEEEARKRAEEEARKKAEAEKLKDELGGLFGEGKGKGETGDPGNQGDPGGDPDASKLEGISTGSGTVGGGLGDRGVLKSPKIEDDSQQQGTVVVRVCVDKAGNVLSADFTQRGSTTSNARLVQLAVNNAKKWEFSEGAVDKQCGTITYRFRVR